MNSSYLTEYPSTNLGINFVKTGKFLKSDIRKESFVTRFCQHVVFCIYFRSISLSCGKQGRTMNLQLEQKRFSDCNVHLYSTDPFTLPLSLTASTEGKRAKENKKKTLKNIRNATYSLFLIASISPSLSSFYHKPLSSFSIKEKKPSCIFSPGYL